MTTKRIASIAALAVLTAGLTVAQERFDMIVRQDFFAGFAGNEEALQRGMHSGDCVVGVGESAQRARLPCRVTQLPCVTQRGRVLGDATGDIAAREV